MANALLFDGTDDEVNCGSAAEIDDLNAATAILLVRGVTTSPAGYAGLMGKGNGGSTTGWGLQKKSGTNRGFQGFVQRATTDSATLTNASPLSSSESVYQWFAFSWDLAASPVGHILYSTFGSPIADAGTYDTQTDGSGAFSSDAASNLWIGRVGEGIRWAGGIAFAGLIPAKLDATALNAVIDDMAGASWIRAMQLGAGGAGTAIDASSYAVNGTVTGTTLITDAPDYWTGGATDLEQTLADSAALADAVAATLSYPGTVLTIPVG